MRPIFISYRRDDSEGQAGRLCDDLREAFGDAQVFMDVTTIEPGADFRRAIDHHTAECGALLALIGRNWLTIEGPPGQRRLDDPKDFVRLEIATALGRDIPVVPVLVQGARMPAADALPPDLHDLSFRNSVELSHARWDSDVKLLIEALRKILLRDQPAAPATPAVPVSGSASASDPAQASATTHTTALAPAPAPSQAPTPAQQVAVAPSRPPARWVPLAGVAALVGVAVATTLHFSAGGNTRGSADIAAAAAAAAASAPTAAASGASGPGGKATAKVTRPVTQPPQRPGAEPDPDLQWLDRAAKVVQTTRPVKPGADADPIEAAKLARDADAFRRAETARQASPPSAARPGQAGASGPVPRRWAADPS